jgi:hypothetical protein
MRAASRRQAFRVAVPVLFHNNRPSMQRLFLLWEIVLIWDAYGLDPLSNIADATCSAGGRSVMGLEGSLGPWVFVRTLPFLSYS